MRTTDRSRRGVTLVLVALLITVLTGLTAFAVDFSRIYSARAQLKVAADAAALSAVTDLGRGEPDEAVADARALLLRRTNLVELHTLTDADMSAADIEPGRWDFQTRTFTPGAWSAANAVRATARYTANWTLARIFGVTQKGLSTASVAALGSPVRSHCFKPWAIPYTNVLATLGRPATDTGYRLSSDDIATLRDNQVPMVFKITTGTVDGGSGLVGPTIINGSFYAVRFPPVQFADGTPGNPTSGGNEYRQAIADLGCTNTGAAAVGDWLDIEQGNMIGPTQQGVGDLCGGTGKTFPCSAQIVVPIWNSRSTASGSTWIQVLYIGAFKLTGFDDGVVSGHLVALATPGSAVGFTPFPGPVTTPALVQ